jgi:cyanophycinase
VIIGGHEDRTGERRILRRFLSVSGGRTARLVVIGTASSQGEAAGEAYRDLFLGLGADDCTVLALQDRRQARSARMLRALGSATGIFFTGGDQLRITSTLGGTPAEAALRRARRRGCAIGGTSAGASAMSGTMIVGGRGEDPPRFSAVRMSPGLGLLPGAVIDQHFAQRGRINRLLAALAQNPGLLGVGLDEDTAIVVEPGGDFFVEGSQSVTVLDGRTARTSGASDAAPDAPMGLTGVTLHVLVRGERYCGHAWPGRADCRIPAASWRQSIADTPGSGRRRAGRGRLSGLGELAPWRS